MKFCKNCGNQIRERALRCDMCGCELVSITGKKSKPCRACNGTGWRDFPVCMLKCHICEGTGYV